MRQNEEGEERVCDILSHRRGFRPSLIMLFRRPGEPSSGHRDSQLLQSITYYRPDMQTLPVQGGADQPCGRHSNTVFLLMGLFCLYKDNITTDAQIISTYITFRPPGVGANTFAINYFVLFSTCEFMMVSRFQFQKGAEQNMEKINTIQIEE